MLDIHPKRVRMKTRAEPSIYYIQVAKDLFTRKYLFAIPRDGPRKLESCTCSCSSPQVTPVIIWWLKLKLAATFWRPHGSSKPCTWLHFGISLSRPLHLPLAWYWRWHCQSRTLLPLWRLQEHTGVVDLPLLIGQEDMYKEWSEQTKNINIELV